MSLPLKEIQKKSFIEKVILHCHDQSLYLVSVEIDGVEHYVSDDEGQLLKSFNKLDLQTKFSRMRVGTMMLRQKSPYDEMIGLHHDPVDNTLEVLIGGEEYASSRPPSTPLN